MSIYIYVSIYYLFAGHHSLTLHSSLPLDYGSIKLSRDNALLAHYQSRVFARDKAVRHSWHVYLTGRSRFARQDLFASVLRLGSRALYHARIIHLPRGLLHALFMRVTRIGRHDAKRDRTFFMQSGVIFTQHDIPLQRSLAPSLLRSLDRVIFGKITSAAFSAVRFSPWRKLQR